MPIVNFESLERCNVASPSIDSCLGELIVAIFVIVLQAQNINVIIFQNKIIFDMLCISGSYKSTKKYVNISNLLEFLRLMQSTNINFF